MAVELLFSILILSGCAALGTKTLYQAPDLSSVHYKKMGYSQLAGEKVLDKIKPGTSDLYQDAMQGFFVNKPVRVEKHDLTTFESIDKIDTEEIKKICSENNLDGYICAQLKYLFVDNRYMYIPLGKSEDTFVDLKLYNKEGVLTMYTKHNTSKGNTYMMAPKAVQTVKDGTWGALKPIMKEIGK